MEIGGLGVVLDRKGTYQQRKDKVAKYFVMHDGRSIGLGDLMNRFAYPLPQIVQICNELEKEDKIKAVAK